MSLAAAVGCDVGLAPLVADGVGLVLGLPGVVYSMASTRAVLVGAV